VIRRRALAATAAAMLLGPLVLAPAAFAEEKIVREAVLSTLDASGAVERTIVSQLLHLGSSGGSTTELRVPKVGELESYRNLSGFRGPSGEGDDYIWRTGDRLDGRALATSYTGKLPIDVKVRYFLDDREISADEIRRESGDVRIEVDLTNVSGSPKSLEHKAVTSPFLTSVVNQYVPFEYVVRAEFPSARWTRIGGEDIKVLADGDKEIASSSGILSPPLTDATKTVAFEAHSEDVLTPRIQIFAMPGLSQDFLDALDKQYDALQALYGGVGSIGENLGAVYDGTVELVNGVEEMLAGVGENDASGKPVVDLGADGLPTTLLGTLGFLSGAMNEQIIPGIGERDPETGRGVIVKDEKGHATTFLGSLQGQQDTYDDKLIPGMQTLIDGMDQLIEGVSGGAPDLVEGLEDMADGLAELLGSLQTGDPSDPGFVEGLQAINAGITQLLGKLQTNSMVTPGFREGLLQISGGLTQLLTGLQSNDPTDPGLREGLLGLAAGLSDLTTNLDASFRPGLEGVQQLVAGIDTLVSDPLVDPLIAQLSGTVAALLAGLGDAADAPTDTTIIGGVELMSAGVAQLLGGLGNSANPPDLVTIIGAVETMMGGVTQLIVGLGNTANPPDQVTVIGALESMKVGLGQLEAGLGDVNDPANETTIIGVLKLIAGGLGQAAPGAGTLVDSVLDALGQMRGGLTNPEFEEEQKALDGMTPKEYFKDCPACFDPDDPKFDPATADPKFQPSFLEVFELFSEGITDALPQLDSFDEDAPGLVDGLEQVADGIDTLASKLHTGDVDDPGLVDALGLVRGGLQQVNQGIFALNELGIRTMRGQIGDEGDAIGRDHASLAEKRADAKHTSALGADAEQTSLTYVFDLPAQTTASNDNARRGAVGALALAGTVLLTRRMRRFDL
jgi:putative membrane protein